jgi:hypothetical protein
MQNSQLELNSWELGDESTVNIRLTSQSIMVARFVDYQDTVFREIRVNLISAM